MSNALARLSCDQVRTAAPADLSLPHLLAALDRLVGSVEPGVVFTGLARLCVPTCCDSCTISIAQDDGAAYRLRWPPADAELDGPAGTEHGEPERPPVGQPDPARPPGAYQLTEHELIIPFDGVIGGYHGSMTWSYRRHRPTGADALLAQLVIERATALVRREQLEAGAGSSAALVTNLRVALTSSREIGMAMGIVMDRHKLSADQAFDLLARISQRRQLRVREVARQITETGVIALPPGLPMLADRPVPGDRRR